MDDFKGEEGLRVRWDKTGLWLRALFGILPFTYTLLDSVVVVVVVVVVVGG